MGFFEDRAKQLGVTTNSNDAFFEQRAKHFQQIDEYQTYGNQMKSAFQNNPESFKTQNINKTPTKSFAEKAQGLNAPDANGKLRTDFPGGWLNPLNDLNRLSNSKAAKLTSNIGSQFVGTGVTGAGASLLAVGTEKLLAKVAPKLAGSIAGRITQKAAAGAISGAPLGVGQSLAQGNDDTDALKGGLDGAIMGGLLGGLGGSTGEMLRIIKPKPLPDYSNVSLRGKATTQQPSKIESIEKAAPDNSPIQSFKTSKGSSYTVGENGSTQRNKSLHAGHETTDVGLKNPSEQTVYVDKSEASRVGSHGALNKDAKPRIVIRDDGLHLITWNSAEGRWGRIGPKIEYTTNPEVGKSPIEFYKTQDESGLGKVSTSYHAGNDITEVSNGKSVNVDSAKGEPIKLTPKEQATQERINQFSRVEEDPTIPNTADQIQTKTKKQGTSFSQKANEAYIKSVDNVHRLDQFDKNVAKVTGGEVKPSDSTYKLALNSRGSDMIARQNLEKNLVDAKGNIVGDSLKSVTKAIPKGQEAAFEDYLVAKHSITRMGRGEKVYADEKGMTIQKAQKIVDNYEQDPQFVEAAQKYYQYNQKLGQSWLVDTGILTQKQWDGYLAANPHYVPNNRIFNEMDKPQQFGSKKGFANQTNPVKRAEGSQRKIVSPIESTIENTAKYVKTAKQNEVAQTLYRNLSKSPEQFAAWGRIVADQPKGDIGHILQTDGIEGVLDEIGRGFEKRTDLTKGNIVSALVDGKRVHMEIHDPQLLEAMTNLSQPSQHFIMDNIGKLTKMMKVVTTGLNPVFGLTRNIFRDIPMSFIASKTSNNPFVIGKDLLGSIIDISTNGKLYNAYKNVGGGHSSSVASDRNLLAQSKEKLLPSGGIYSKAKRVITKGFHALENLNNAVESAPRLGEFKRLQNGSYDSKVKGLYEANDITVNFNKYGNYTKQADALFPYLNAAVQGLDKFVRIYKDNPKQAIAKSIAALTLPTIALYVMNKDNPDYQKLSKYTKDNFMVIPKGDGTFYKIAKPREVGIIFSSGVERALQAFAKDDPEAFREFGTTFMTNFFPPGINGLAKEGLPGVLGDTIAGPIQSLASNKDFLGRPIVSGSLDKLSPELQYDNKTSEPAKKLGNLINYSPKKIDFLIKSYGGIIGQLGIPATTQGNSIKDTIMKQITTDPNYSNDISQDFYNAKDKADRAKADSKVTGEQLTKDLTPMFNKITDVLSLYRKQSNAIQKNPLLSREEKKKQQDDIQTKMNDIQSNFLKLIK